jgi:uncharacterized membrane protein YoaK (UPF0700 family)
MLRKFPRWVWIGAWLLAATAGMVNAVGFLGLEHQAVTHLTGVTTQFGIAAAHQDGAFAFHLCAVATSFVTGAVLSGLFVGDSTLRLGRRYGLTMLVEAALLCAAVPLFKHHNFLGSYLASCACGLQNAMASTYSGSTIRTTHVSGMFTDLGISLGHRLRRMPVDPLRVRLCLLIISAFACGSAIGAAAFTRIGYNALYVPASVLVLISTAYAAYRLTARRTGSIA